MRNCLFNELIDVNRQNSITKKVQELCEFFALYRVQEKDLKNFLRNYFHNMHLRVKRVSDKEYYTFIPPIIKNKDAYNAAKKTPLFVTSASKCNWPQ